LVEFENGQPVGGAEHFDADGKRHAETDGRGIARAAGTRRADWAGGRWLWSGRRCYVKEWRFANRRTGKVAALVLWSGGRTVSGRVVDQHGKAVPQATVTLTQGRDRWTATTDRTGSYAIADVTPTRVRARLSQPTVFPETEEQFLAAGTPAATTPGDLTAVRGTRLTIRVVGAGGAPVEGVKVRYPYRRLSVNDTGGRYHLTTTTAADGIAAILRVPGDDLRIELDKRGAERFYDLLGAKLPPRIDLYFNMGQCTTWVPIRCRDAGSGADVAPTAVYVRRTDEPWSTARVRRGYEQTATCHPDDGNDFEVLDVRDLPPDEWEFYLWSPGYRPAVIRARSTQHGIYPPLDVKLQPATTTVHARVFAAKDGSPLAGAQIEAAPDDDQGLFLHPTVTRPVKQTGKDGAVKLELPPGRWTLRVSERRHARMTQRVTVTGAAAQDIAVGLPPQQPVKPRATQRKHR
ncbi:MAG: carboxypeptidase-like regulatory domain-containing protein, partial [Planctomycetota bacterium]